MATEKEVLAQAEQGLRYATGLLEAGWIQGRRMAWDEEDRFYCCAQGALRRTLTMGPYLSAEAFDVLREAVTKALHVRDWDGLGLVGWNDAPERRKEDVIGLFAAATLDVQRRQEAAKACEAVRR